MIKAALENLMKLEHMYNCMAQVVPIKQNKRMWRKIDDRVREGGATEVQIVMTAINFPPDAAMIHIITNGGYVSELQKHKLHFDQCLFIWQVLVSCCPLCILKIFFLTACLCYVACNAWVTQRQQNW